MESIPFTKDASQIRKNYEKKKKYSTLLKRNYILHGTIGGGDFGIVKIATSEIHGCDVAIKIVSKFSAPSEYVQKFFPREVETVRGLKHENLIKYYQSIETTHRVYIIMEYAENGNLFDYIKKHVYLNERQSQKWFSQLVDVVKYCHDRNIVHRDIKCENILLDRNFNIKLSDFGFARRVFRVDNHVGLVNTFCGSYAYIAPEIFKGRPYNPFKSDIWSMGVVLYAMVHGCLPFDDTNYFILAKQIRSEVKFPPKPVVSSECRALIIRILKPRKLRPELTDIRDDPWLNTVESEIYSNSDEDGTTESHEDISTLLNNNSKLSINEDSSSTTKYVVDDDKMPISAENLSISDTKLDDD